MGLIRTVTSSSWSLHSLLNLYWNLVRSKLEYASVAWHSITPSGACKLECIQPNFVSLCYHLTVECLNYMKLKTLSAQGHYTHVLTLTNVFNNSKYFPTFLEGVGSRVPNKKIRYFSFFNVDFKRWKCLSDRCASVSMPSTVILTYPKDVRFSLM
jgi:hypothetical protein